MNHWMVPQTPQGKPYSQMVFSYLGPLLSRLSRTESPFSTRRLSSPRSQNRKSTRLTSMKIQKRLRVKRPLTLLSLVFVIPINANISFKPVSTSPPMKHPTITFFRVVVTGISSAKPLEVHVSKLVTMLRMAMSSVIKVSVVLGDWMRMTMGKAIRPGLFTKRCTQKNGMVSTISEITMY